jgi:membrane protease YdiL (CAAX protease family)
VAAISTAILVTPLCVLFAGLKRGISVKRYLALRPVRTRQLAIWAGVTILFCAITDVLSWFLGQPLVSESILHAYRSVIFVPLLWVGVVVGAPLCEEFYFRGFLFAGIRNSRLGMTGAIVLTSAAWAPLHVQYGLYGVSEIFVLGLILGYARLCSGSLVTPIVMHAINNLLAMLEAAVWLRV